MGELRRRTLSSAAAVPAALALVWAGGWFFAAGVAALAVGGTQEAFRLLEGRAAVFPRLAAALALAWTAADLFVPRWSVPSALILTISLPWVFRRAGLGQRMAGTFWAGAYVAGLLGSLLPLRAQNSVLLLAVLVACWGTDVTAYLTGRAFGRHKLAPRLSPGKTWEGAVGGYLVGGGLVFLVVAGFGLPRGEAWVLGALLPILAQGGDLAESALKRWVGVKDSGSFLPGHGGILDRVDSLLAVAPVAYLLARGWTG